MRSTAIVALLFGLLSATAGAQTLTEGIAAPTVFAATPTAGGTLQLTYTWAWWCPESLCMIPTSVDIERNGAIVSSAPMAVDPAHASKPGAAYTVLLDSTAWARGDCFRIRVTAKSGDHVVASAFTAKACVPATT